MFAHLDFVAKRAWVGSQERVLADQLGGAFDPAALHPDGMAILSTNSNRPVAAGDFAVALAGPNIGVVVDWLDVETPVGDNGSVRLLQWSDNLDPAQAENLVTLYARYYDNSVSADDWSRFFVNSPTGVLMPGAINRAVFNMGRPSGSDHESEIAVNGGVLSGTAIGYAFSPSPLVAIGFELLHAPSLTTAVLGGKVRSISVFPTA